ncbi:MAG: polymerase, sigma-24 subunit, subfamily [Aeromicrobium sp.]|nr:polymerase, sigma-24 subunit, subfamily [Aeromicrobium sp.]
MISSRLDDFEAFYAEHRDPCFRAVLAIVRHVDDAEELVAEAFARAYSRWDQLAAHPRPAAWVTVTATNLQRDRWRRERRPRLALPMPTPSERQADSDMVDAVHALPERQRQVVALRVLLELSAEETGEALGIDAGTVGTHLRRALATLRVNWTKSLPTSHCEDTR